MRLPESLLTPRILGLLVLCAILIAAWSFSATVFGCSFATLSFVSSSAPWYVRVTWRLALSFFARSICWYFSISNGFGLGFAIACAYVRLPGAVTAAFISLISF